MENQEKGAVTEEDIKEYTYEAKQKLKQRKLVFDPNLFDFQKEFDINGAVYEIDPIQDEMTTFYIKQDPFFKRAYFTNYSPKFFALLQYKARLREPLNFSTMGDTRTGKSYSMITLLCYLNALNGKKTTIDYICGNSIELLEKLKNMPEDMTKDCCFLVDESKKSVFGYGSTAKKMKIEDINNIVAMNNISIITICPTGFMNAEASTLGLRTYGKCPELKINRFMFYNLSESGHTKRPKGMIYLPIFTEVVPYWRELERDYLIRKKTWIQDEISGNADILLKIQKKEGERFFLDQNYQLLKTKDQRKQYIALELGSEFTTKEIESIELITQLYRKGAIKVSEEKSED